MLTVLQAATYISDRYFREYGEPIEEKKLQKLMYFAQRESIIQTGAPMFEGEFIATQRGPIMKDVRIAYLAGALSETISDSSLSEYHRVFDDLFTDFAYKKTSSLIRLTQGQLSWERARVGFGEYDPSEVPMSLADISEDAANAKKRYIAVSVLQKLQPILDQYRTIFRNINTV